ncbi:hypothetical protein [Embleya hyalina]|uniref:Uncharacterized protein n=1 Tax=Embleya hyalina TaxID=516124 RepID=A0A401YYP3_9ACTN|nr:hypothetical protein [Embleya hyalina]GCD99756.1 hypothetical protein EHYA_07478 [Embleya hyalina]
MTTTLAPPPPLPTVKAEPPAEPSIVVLCGSMRFTREMARENARLTALGHIVLAPAVDMRKPTPLSTDPASAARMKQRLDELHRAKIRMAGWVVVICPGGYIGESTRREIDLAAELGKPITYRDARVAGGTAEQAGREAATKPVFAENFVGALREVRPHCGDDQTLEVTRGIRLQARRDRLHVVASGLYTLAVTLIDAPGIGTWDVHVPRRAVHALTTLAHTDDAYLEHVPADDDGVSALVVHLGAQQYTVRHRYIGDYPNWRPLVAQALAAGPALDHETVLYADRLARFTRDGHDAPLMIWGHAPGQPLIVTRGTHHIGLIKPLRGEYGPDPDEIRDTWRHTLADTETGR